MRISKWRYQKVQNLNGHRNYPYGKCIEMRKLIYLRINKKRIVYIQKARILPDSVMAARTTLDR